MTFDTTREKGKQTEIELITRVRKIHLGTKGC